MGAAVAMPELRHAQPEGLLTAVQVAALLGVSLRTFYRLPWFRTRKVSPTDGTAVRYRPSDVALYQSLRSSRN